MSKENLNNVWEHILSHVRSKINQQSFQRWFSQTRLIELDDESAVIAVPNKFLEDWLTDHYSQIIDDAFLNSFSHKIRITYRHGSEYEKADASKSSTSPGIQRHPKNIPDISRAVYAEQVLNPRYTFSNFVVGDSNRFAHAASLAVAESPARAYSPLFIYGRVGLGKTHLMQAIGQHILLKNPDTRVCYISSESFTNQLISAIQHRTTTKFREKFRNVNALLIDDIQFIGGKESTQEEFFHTFNALYDAHKQIVISSDRSPKEIKTLEERLVSRFQWGLITDIQPPDVETRIAILKKKSELERVIVPDDVAEFIAVKIKSNIRELEGALIRVVAFSSMTEQKITLSLAKEMLKDMFIEEEKKVTIDIIQKVVAEFFDVRISELKAKTRAKSIVYPRQIAMFLARELTSSTLPEIGESFGGRDHTTVLHACSKIENDVKSKENIKVDLDIIKEKIRSC